MSSCFVHEIVFYHIVFLYFVERQLKIENISYLKKVNIDNSVSLFFRRDDIESSTDVIYKVKSLYVECF